jgi:hypothetical protein
MSYFVMLGHIRKSYASLGQVSSVYDRLYYVRLAVLCVRLGQVRLGCQVTSGYVR